MSLKFAKSLQGHDKNKIYVVLKEDENFVYLINGKEKTTDKPKKKKLKHIQIIKYLPQEVIEIVSDESVLSDEEASKMIQIYLRSIQCQKQM
ncbi:MAG: hypothetical protein K5675_04115 [Lachnospiraceae bacterium]|nr:hypothetical protein [Lachnospiraceae bacterium]